MQDRWDNSVLRSSSNFVQHRFESCRCLVMKPRYRKKYTKLVDQEYSKNYVSNTVTLIQNLIHLFETGNQFIMSKSQMHMKDLAEISRTPSWQLRASWKLCTRKKYHCLRDFIGSKTILISEKNCKGKVRIKCQQDRATEVLKHILGIFRSARGYLIGSA